MPAIASSLVLRRVRNGGNIRFALGLFGCALFFGSLGRGVLSGDSICLSLRGGASGLCFVGTGAGCGTA
jgi:hypothetical protein